MDRPTEGKVYIDGKDIFEFDDEKLAIFRRRQVGLIYQFYNFLVQSLLKLSNLDSDTVVFMKEEVAVREIVDADRGHISVESGDGGTKFFVSRLVKTQNVNCHNIFILGRKNLNFPCNCMHSLLYFPLHQLRRFVNHSKYPHVASVYRRI